MVHICMYDAWAAYDEHAIGTHLSGALRQHPAEQTQANKEKAISYAAYHALYDVFPTDTESVYKPLMRELGYAPDNNSTDIDTPEGIGNVACAAILEFRHHDNANQLGDMLPPGQQSGPLQKAAATGAAGAYSDWTGYTPVNSPGTLPARASFTKPLNPDHWQPLTFTDASGNLVVQMFSTAHWGLVTPFALPAVNSQPVVIPSGVRDLLSERSLPPELLAALDPLPAKYGSPEYQRQAEGLVALSTNLTDEQKMLVEFWSEAPDSEQPAARWLQFAEFVAERDHLSLDDQVKLFFVLSNAMMDADIAAWDAKRYYDSVRPATAIPLLFRGKTVRVWGGPGKGNVAADGGNWIPYQPATSPTPPSPEYVSEVSAESAAAAEILKLFTGSDSFDYSVSFKKGSSKIEPGATPVHDVALHWATFTEAADQAGMSGRYGGIQFAAGDLAGRKLGRLAAQRAWTKAQSLFNPPAGSRSLSAPSH